jgi:hypothetical protein
MSGKDPSVDAPLVARPAPARAAPRYATRSGWKATAPALATGASTTALVGCGLFWPILAPIFEHGYGSGVFGCVVVAPPAFLSEEDAIEIVRSELQAAGYDGVLTGEDCAAFSVDKLAMKEACGPADWEVLDGAFISDRFDLCDPEAGFSLEVVTRSDHDRVIEDAMQMMWCSVSSISIRNMADYLSLQAVAGARTRYVGVFYDPVGRESYDYYWDTGGEDTGLSAYEQADRDLRAQVQDFVGWLEERG